MLNRTRKKLRKKVPRNQLQSTLSMLERAAADGTMEDIINDEVERQSVTRVCTAPFLLSPPLPVSLRPPAARPPLRPSPCLPQPRTPCLQLAHCCGPLVSPTAPQMTSDGSHSSGRRPATLMATVLGNFTRHPTAQVEGSSPSINLRMWSWVKNLQQGRGLANEEVRRRTPGPSRTVSEFLEAIGRASVLLCAPGGWAAARRAAAGSRASPNGICTGSLRQQTSRAVGIKGEEGGRQRGRPVKGGEGNRRGHRVGFGGLWCGGKGRIAFKGNRDAAGKEP